MLGGSCAGHEGHQIGFAFVGDTPLMGSFVRDDDGQRGIGHHGVDGRLSGEGYEDPAQAEVREQCGAPEFFRRRRGALESIAG